MLPKEIFENVSGVQQIVNEGQSFYIIDKVDFEEGTRVWIRGAQFHQKGMGTPESIFAINLVKRIIVEGARLALRVEFIPGLFLIALKTKKEAYSHYRRDCAGL